MHCQGFKSTFEIFKKLFLFLQRLQNLVWSCFLVCTSYGKEPRNCVCSFNSGIALHVHLTDFCLIDLFYYILQRSMFEFPTQKESISNTWSWGKESLGSFCQAQPNSNFKFQVVEFALYHKIYEYISSDRMQECTNTGIHERKNTRVHWRN